MGYTPAKIKSPSICHDNRRRTARPGVAYQVAAALRIIPRQMARSSSKR